MKDEDDIRESLFQSGSARALICSVDGVEAGFAVYFFNYSTWQGKRGLYLEDLYITPAHRNAGAGRALLQHLAHLAPMPVRTGCADGTTLSPARSTSPARTLVSLGDSTT